MTDSFDVIVGVGVAFARALLVLFLTSFLLYASKSAPQHEFGMVRETSSGGCGDLKKIQATMNKLIKIREKVRLCCSR
jgi:hypothetical protein